MLTITLRLYLVCAFLDPAIVHVALNKSLQVLKMISSILVVVFFLIALLNRFIQTKKIAQYHRAIELGSL
jgi:RsiW-degrading membrane proteinase PrsW (M82 family)